MVQVGFLPDVERAIRFTADQTDRRSTETATGKRKKLLVVEWEEHKEPKPREIEGEVALLALRWDETLNRWGPASGDAGSTLSQRSVFPWTPPLQAAIIYWGV